MGEVDERNRVTLSQISGVQLVDESRHEFAIWYSIEGGAAAA